MGIHQKIEYITGKIKDMIHMIERSVSGDKILDKQCGNDPGQEYLTDDRQQELGIMILKMQDNELEEKCFSRLDKLLSTDLGALKFYIEFTQICVGLHSIYGKSSDPAKTLIPKTHKV